MKDQRIVAAYRAVEPDKAALARMWAAIEEAAEEANAEAANAEAVDDGREIAAKREVEAAAARASAVADMRATAETDATMVKAAAAERWPVAAASSEHAFTVIGNLQAPARRKVKKGRVWGIAAAAACLVLAVGIGISSIGGFTASKDAASGVTYESAPDQEAEGVYGVSEANSPVYMTEEESFDDAAPSTAATVLWPAGAALEWQGTVYTCMHAAPLPAASVGTLLGQGMLTATCEEILVYEYLGEVPTDATAAGAAVAVARKGAGGVEYFLFQVN